MLVFMAGACTFFAIGNRVNYLSAFLAIGMPMIGVMIIVWGSRAANNNASETCMKWGAGIVAVCFPIAIPTWFYILIVLVS